MPFAGLRSLTTQKTRGSEPFFWDGLKPIFSTLRIRLVIWISVAVMLMVVVTMIIVRQVVHRTLIYEFDQILLGDAREISLMPTFNAEDKMARELNRRALGHAHQHWFAEIYDSDGDALWWTDSVPDILEPPDFVPAPPETPDRLLFSEVSSEEKSYRTLLKFFPDNKYWVRVGSTKASLLEDFDLLDRIMVLATMLIVLVAPLAAYALAGRATRPLAWIIATTARLQPQKLDERLPIRGSNDELDRLSATINGMLDRIASYLERNRDFIANAAHELRSPLAAIRSTVEVALNQQRSTEEYQSLLTDVMIECTQLGELINRLLLLAEGDAGRLGSRGQQVRLDRLVRQSADMFQAVAESQGIDLRIEATENAVVPGDEIHLRQVVRNLIDNAIKFSLPPGEIRLRVYTDAAKKAAILTVADTGPGISPEQLPRIFERFYRGDRSRHREGEPGGYGLGLSICQLIVRSLGGDITVESRLGHGTTFTVTLPLAE